MPDILGLPLEQALLRVGSREQFVRIDDLVEADGPARGARRLHVVTGGGLEYDIHPDRGLDIGAASIDGIPLAWLSSTGITAPALYDPVGRGWLRTFGGGLVTTCGLTSFGPPADDESGVVGMHGRVGHIPARVTRVETTDEQVVVAGSVRETAVFAENLMLRREISSPVGGRRITISDTVTNEGEDASPLMVLYHVNLGWPLIDEGTVLDIPAAEMRPRDADAEAGVAEWHRVGAPTPGFSEQVFIHTAGPDRRATVTNPTRGLTLTLSHSDTLPALFEWKMTATRHYVVGLEPANTPVIQGRAAARAQGSLPMIQPGETVAYRIDIDVEATS